MSSIGISQKEYLKKYLSGDDKKKKKKKPKMKPTINRLRIVDDDIDLGNMRLLDDGELELYDLQEDAPQIAGIIDERPEEVKIKEKFATKKWKVIADENDEGFKIIDKLNVKTTDSTRDVSSLGDASSNRDDIGGNRDLSPQRRNKDKDDSSPVRKSTITEDLSPPRKNSYGKERICSFTSDGADNRDLSPQRKGRNKEDLSSGRKSTFTEDSSPPRRRKSSYGKERTPSSPSDGGDRDLTHLGRSRNKDDFSYGKKKNFTEDLSPPRKRKSSYGKERTPSSLSDGGDRDQSHQGRSRNKDDLSSGRKNNFAEDSSPPRKRKSSYGKERTPSSFSDGDGGERDLSPPRRSKNKDDLSSVRKNNFTRNLSPPRKRKSSYGKEGPPSSLSDGGDRDLSPPRRNRNKDDRKSNFTEDLSPPRKRKGSYGEERTHKEFSKHRASSPRFHKEKNIGRSSHEGYNRNDNRKEESSTSRGKTAFGGSPERKSRQSSKEDGRKQTLDGRKAGLVGADELKAEIADLRHREKEMFQKMDVEVSGRGAAPVMRDRKTGKRRDLEEEAREKNEKDAKHAERKAKYMQWGKGLKQVSDQTEKMKEDMYEMSKPLARYADDADLDRLLRDQEREGDPMLDYIRSKTKTEGEKGKSQYEGSFMPNRFGVRPGYRWDGVDRSNGYEKQWFETQNSKKAVEEEAYKWSTSDM